MERGTYVQLDEKSSILLWKGGKNPIIHLSESAKQKYIYFLTSSLRTAGKMV